MKTIKQETATSKILRILTEADDFMTARQVQEATGMSMNLVQTTLEYLFKRHAVGLLEAGTALWWYPTPKDDNRVRTVKERAPECHPRARKKRTKPPVC